MGALCSKSQDGNVRPKTPGQRSTPPQITQAPTPERRGMIQDYQSNPDDYQQKPNTRPAAPREFSRYDFFDNAFEATYGVQSICWEVFNETGKGLFGGDWDEEDREYRFKKMAGRGARGSIVGPNSLDLRGYYIARREWVDYFLDELHRIPTERFKQMVKDAAVEATEAANAASKVRERDLRTVFHHLNLTASETLCWQEYKVMRTCMHCFCSPCIHSLSSLFSTLCFMAYLKSPHGPLRCPLTQAVMELLYGEVHDTAHHREQFNRIDTTGSGEIEEPEWIAFFVQKFRERSVDEFNAWLVSLVEANEKEKVQSQNGHA